MLQTDAPPAPVPAPPSNVGTGAQIKSSIFGSFWIDESEFALPVSAIREVVNEPDMVSSVPLAPPYMCGLFNLRGMIIPIIDLRILLGFPERASQEPRKVAIIENADKCIGMLFDFAGEVLNEPKSARVGFQEAQDGVKDVIIDGVLKLENGNRIVQILDPYEVLRIEQVPKAESSGRIQRENLGKRLSCVSFQLGHTYCAMDLRFVQEVREMPEIDESLLSHGCVIGTANLRGVIIPVVDFRSFMGDEPPFKPNGEALRRRRLLVMKSDGGLVGLMVYSIDSIIPFFERDVLPFAKLALPRGNIVSGCLVDENDQLVMLLDQTKLMTDPVLVESARICRDVYNTSGETNETEGTSLSNERKTFILFSIGNRFAMDTLNVSEVIDKPPDLLAPPYALEYVEGIINLRGDLITLINMRTLYSLKPCDKLDQKVVVFRQGSQKYAMLVDSVDEIVMTTADKVSDDKKSSYKGAMSASAEDVSGVLHISPEGQGEMMVMIMNVDALVSRCAGAAPSLE